MPSDFRPCGLVPTYDNPRTIRRVVERIRAFIPDVVVVDDGSAAEGREAEYGLSADDRQEFWITLKDSDAAATEKEYGLVVGKETEGGRFARAVREGKPEPNVFVLSPAALESLRTPFREKKDAPPPETPKDETPKDEGPKDEGPKDQPPPGENAPDGE